MPEEKKFHFAPRTPIIADNNKADGGLQNTSKEPQNVAILSSRDTRFRKEILPSLSLLSSLLPIIARLIHAAAEENCNSLRIAYTLQCYRYVARR